MQTPFPGVMELQSRPSGRAGVSSMIQNGSSKQDSWGLHATKLSLQSFPEPPLLRSYCSSKVLNALYNCKGGLCTKPHIIIPQLQQPFKVKSDAKVRELPLQVANVNGHALRETDLLSKRHPRPRPGPSYKTTEHHLCVP